MKLETSLAMTPVTGMNQNIETVEDPSGPFLVAFMSSTNENGIAGNGLLIYIEYAIATGLPVLLLGDKGSRTSVVLYEKLRGELYPLAGSSIVITEFGTS